MNEETAMKWFDISFIKTKSKKVFYCYNCKLKFSAGTYKFGTKYPKCLMCAVKMAESRKEASLKGTKLWFKLLNGMIKGSKQKRLSENFVIGRL